MPKTTEAPKDLPERVIKKYPNRRLYDTHTSSYITLAEIKQLVMDHKAFAVVDAKTSEDLTRSILLQIILEEEAGGSPCSPRRCWQISSGFTAIPCRALWAASWKKICRP